MPKVAKDGLIEACGLHEVGTDRFDPHCEGCKLLCRGNNGCHLLLPLTEFKQQHRKKDGKPELFSASLWKPNCSACASKAKQTSDAPACKWAGGAKRQQLYKAVLALLLPAVRFFVSQQTGPVIQQYEGNKWVRLLEHRKAEVLHESAKEELMQPSKAIPPDQEQNETTRALWLLQHCEWRDAALQQLVQKMERELAGMKAARDSALNAPQTAEAQLHIAVAAMQPGAVQAMQQAIFIKSFCGRLSETESVLAGTSWLDHRLTLTFDADLPWPASFMAPALQGWIGTLSPTHVRAEWFQDGETFFGALATRTC